MYMIPLIVSIFSHVQLTHKEKKYCHSSRKRNKQTPLFSSCLLINRGLLTFIYKRQLEALPNGINPKEEKTSSPQNKLIIYCLIIQETPKEDNYNENAKSKVLPE